jgi:DNA-binding NarL/FixJ family response regulator
MSDVHYKTWEVKDTQISTVLTVRQWEVMELLCQGLTNKEVAAKMELSAKTVEKHRTVLYEKVGVNNVVCLLREAIKLGHITIERYDRAHT